MRLLKEEKTVSKILRKTVEFFLLLFLFAPLSAQTFINDFCYLEEYSVGYGYNKIIVHDYSQDNISDIILIKGKQKEVVELEGDSETLFKKYNPKFFFYNITDLKRFTYKPGSGRFFLFLSRSERLAGLITFTKYGTLQLMNKIEFDSYPGNSIVGDLDRDGIREAVVFGSNFEGLSILREDNFVLYEEKIFRERVFSEAVFMDLDYDETLDIVCYDMLSGALVFLYNEMEGNLFEYRRIDQSEEAKNLTKADFNRDGYTDLVFSSGSSINFFMGDSVSSFVDRRKLTLQEDVVDFELGDFNKDNKIDIAYLLSSGELYLSFAISDDSLSLPVIYSANQFLVDLSLYKTARGESLLALASNGKLFRYSRERSDSLFTISTAVKPSVVNVFQHPDKKMKSLCFVDSYDEKFKILIGEGQKRFLYYLETPLNRYYNRLIPSAGNTLGSFYLYATGEKLLEQIEVDFKGYEFRKTKFYTTNNIIEIKVDNKESKDSVSALLFENGTVYLSYPDKNRDESFFRTDTLISNVVNPALSLHNNSISFWKEDSSTMEFGMLDVNDKTNFNIIERFGAGNKPREIRNYSFPFKKGTESVFIGSAKLNNTPFIYYYNKSRLYKIFFETFNYETEIADKGIYFFASAVNNKKYLYCYDRKNRALFSTDFEKGNKNIILSGLYKNIYMKDFVVNHLLPGQLNLIFIDELDNFIKVRRIE